MARGDISARLDQIDVSISSPDPAARLSGVNAFESLVDEVLNGWRAAYDPSIKYGGNSDANILRGSALALEVMDARAAVEVFRSGNRPGFPVGLQERVNVAAGRIESISRDMQSTLDALLSQAQSARSASISTIPTVRATVPAGGSLVPARVGTTEQDYQYGLLGLIDIPMPVQPPKNFVFFLFLLLGLAFLSK